MDLRFTPPLDATGLLDFFRRRAIAGVEDITGDTYRRTLRLAHGPAVISLTIGPDSVSMALDESADPRDHREAVARSRSLLDLDADPAAVDGVLASDPRLAAAVRLRPGKRVPGAVDRFELAVRAVLGQQVSVAAARRLAIRIVAVCGPELPAPNGALTHLFPGPQALQTCDPAIFTMPQARRSALLALAKAWPCLDRDALLAVPGIGPWTADYVAMRSGDSDVLPRDDAAVRTALRRLPGPVDPDLWRPFRTYATLHLWDEASQPSSATEATASSSRSASDASL